MCPLGRMLELGGDLPIWALAPKRQMACTLLQVGKQLREAAMERAALGATGLRIHAGGQQWVREADAVIFEFDHIRVERRRKPWLRISADGSPHEAAYGADAVAAGNLLDGPGVPQAMIDAFAAEPGLSLAARLLAALAAGLTAGGEAGPVHSAGLLVAGSVSWPVTDLRVDWTEGDPVAELAALHELWAPQEEDYLRRAVAPHEAPSYGVAGDA